MPTAPIIQLAYRGIQHFENLIEKEIPFSFPRYGDGEFSSILGYSGKNCDGVRYTEELRNSLLETLINPHLNDEYYYGILAVALRFYRPYIEKFTSIHNLKMTWTEATFLVAANRHGKFSCFLDTLRKRPLLYVGPTYLRKLPDVLGLKIDYFIEIPEKTAFEQREVIRNEILIAPSKADFIGFSAGPASKWLIWSLFPDIGDKYTLFDF
ncbi:hypothetical protein LCGC14_2803700, partial [marine sediment metagenome]